MRSIVPTKSPTRVWRFAFDRSRSGGLLILQNLLLAINAHINLDLGVVAGTTFRGQALEDFHDDFNRINDILGSLIPADTRRGRTVLSAARRPDRHRR